MNWPLLLLWTSVLGVATSPCCPDDNIYNFDENRCSTFLDDDTAISIKVNPTLISLQENATLNISLKCSGTVSATNFAMRPNGDSIETGTTLKFVIPAGRYCLTRIIDGNSTLLEKRDVALICFPDSISTVEYPPEIAFYIFCIVISAVMLFLTLVVYMLVPQLQDVQGKCLMCTCLSLCLAKSCISFSLLFITSFLNGFCQYLALFTYFWMLSSFFWLNVVAFNVWRLTVFQNTPLSKFYLQLCYAYGWGIPLVFLATAAINHHLPTDEIEPESSCWIDGPINMLFYFVLPVIGLTCFNILLFVFTGCQLWIKTRKEEPVYKLRYMKYRCCTYLKLFIIMGLPLALRMFAGGMFKSPFYRAILNVAVFLQGAFIFLVLVIFRKRALRGLINRLNCRYFPSSWVAGKDSEETESVVAEEMELPQTAV